MDDLSDTPRSLPLLQNLLRDSCSTSAAVRIRDRFTWTLHSDKQPAATIVSSQK